MENDSECAWKMQTGKTEYRLTSGQNNECSCIERKLQVNFNSKSKFIKVNWNPFHRSCALMHIDHWPLPPCEYACTMYFAQILLRSSGWSKKSKSFVFCIFYILLCVCVFVLQFPFDFSNRARVFVYAHLNKFRSRSVFVSLFRWTYGKGVEMHWHTVMSREWLALNNARC